MAELAPKTLTLSDLEDHFSYLNILTRIYTSSNCYVCTRIGAYATCSFFAKSGSHNSDSSLRVREDVYGSLHTKRRRVLLSKRGMKTSGFLKVTVSYVHCESGSISETLQDTETLLIQTTNRKRYMTAKAVMPNTSITYKTNRTGTITAVSYTHLTLPTILRV